MPYIPDYAILLASSFIMFCQGMVIGAMVRDHQWEKGLTKFIENKRTR